jgi:hypothetical protein
MLLGLQILTVVVVAIAMALSLAHALELPGKMRLSKEQYLAVQPIYYPGFTFGGIAEPLGILLLLGLLYLTPGRTLEFWMIAGSLAALLASHGAYWLLTHPINNFWLKDFKMSGAGVGFFSFGIAGRADPGELDWARLRDWWEYSHVVRAGFGLISFALLVAAVAL